MATYLVDPSVVIEYFIRQTPKKPGFLPRLLHFVKYNFAIGHT